MGDTVNVEKPLHVQVAIALGWVGVKIDGIADWPWCGVEHSEGLRREIPRYDTDWSAGGPLIERYRFHLYVMGAGAWLGVPGGTGDWIAESDVFPVVRVRYKTPLEAVCRLILALAEAGKLPK